mmetsp:Transcript_10871/g.16556  ORF Transcript_10871/g.16556 Transcript_10871/m.16556 type:complete len:504 (+) Transcript_10871:166-1677(+)|eukprot:CAMPEP_0185031774 /NCGR_PEP_ID=MMETSP1103-20130426/19411_1 /TAXON_ID=36769 /ORGANISM="Paraphysomonas bandaiensis, Strain Caron Lab Isolate" /LENGTH=503 /DNA_ID=CAMNT_0027567411 /DNA_START=75 /DNA_END=1586 /DNA_ORIENTATION=+
MSNAKAKASVVSRYDSVVSDMNSLAITRHYLGFDEEFWEKVVRAAEGKATLDKDDAKHIITLLRGGGEDATESKIASLIVSRLRDQQDLLDEGFLQYLSENYNNTSLQSRHDPETVPMKTTESAAELDHSPAKPFRRLSSQVIDVLKNLKNWDFDIFALQDITSSPIVTITTHCLTEYDLINALDFDSGRLRSFLSCIHDAYNALPYHNSLHGADVTQTVFYFLSTAHVIEALQLNQIATASIIIAAAIHDVGHPGLNGKFLITTNSQIAIQYSDKSPLEMMHLATAFRLWRMDDNNFTERIPITVYREMRRLIVEMVLLTDNDMHFALLNRLDRLITVHSSSPDQPPLPPATSELQSVPYLLSTRTPASHPNTDDRQLLLLQVTLHTADVSNTAKPWNIYNAWLERIMEEFYLQGDMERSLNMPISYAFDRLNPVKQSKFQVGFIKAIVGPLYKTFSKIDGIDISECLEHLSSNARVWKKAIAAEDNENCSRPADISRTDSI